MVWRCRLSVEPSVVQVVVRWWRSHGASRGYSGPVEAVIDAILFLFSLASITMTSSSLYHTAILTVAGLASVSKGHPRKMCKRATFRLHRKFHQRFTAQLLLLPEWTA